MRTTAEHSNNKQRNTLICFSHLRWNFVFQRPQHLLTRFARRADVVFFEEPIFEDRAEPHLALSVDPSGVCVATPMLPAGRTHLSNTMAQRALLDRFLLAEGITGFTAWYYTPMALAFSRHLRPTLTVYDCMDELSAFHGAPPELMEMEQELFSRADIVFTGGHSLYEVKKRQHSNVHAFPSSIDHAHFSAARRPLPDPEDQRHIAHPRVGFFGVLDERLDRDLVRDVAVMHPECQLVLIGPVVKISPDDLPRAGNIHYLGQKSYAELPAYIANWDVAMLPFAQNASTRFISPTKTPEYLAAGKPVVSTPIRDVVNPYGTMELVGIAANAAEFSTGIEKALHHRSSQWLKQVDTLLARTSWDKTFEGMWQLMQQGRAQNVRTINIPGPERRVANL